MASRTSASQPASRPPSRPKVADTSRGRRTPHATAGRRAGAEARRAPNATAGRCFGETGPGALLRTRFSETRVADARRRRRSIAPRWTAERPAVAWHRSRGPRSQRVTVAPLLALRRARESRAPLSTRIRAPAGVRSLRMCRGRSRLPWAHSQGGHPREWPPGEARHSHRAGRRDARRWP
jgi:hypothetical protein